MSSVLVAYATKFGSTKETADAVTATLRERGLEVDEIPAGDVGSLDGYSAVVLGSALYNHKWHRDAMRFASRHRAALERVPVAVFTLGPVNDTPEEFGSAREQLDAVLASVSWLQPTAVTVFGGRFDPSQLRFPGASLLARAMPASDIVNPSAIAEWARALPAALAIETAAAAR